MDIQHNDIKGWAFQGNKTKALAEHLPPRSIAVLNHKDIDVVAAEMLIAKKIKAIINLDQSMTGTFEHNGVHILLKSKIHVFDIKSKQLTVNFNGKRIKVKNNELFVWQQKKWIKQAELIMYDTEMVNHLKEQAIKRFPTQFETFVKNSFFYGERELSTFIHNFPKLPQFQKLSGKDVLIVTRGNHYLEDLKVARTFLKKKKIAIIAVDGGADGVLKCHLKPDYIIGDMDSVSEKALRSGADLVAHCYPNGQSPGGIRLAASGLRYYSLPFVGTSEDVALMCAYYGGAKKIYMIGSHMSMNEFLEKGRKGMGSSLLARIKAGHQLIDLKGIHHLYEYKKDRLSYSPLSYIVPVAGLVAFAIANPRFEILFSIFKHWLKVGVL